MNLNDIRKVIEISDRANKTKTDLVEAVFGILVNENSTVSCSDETLSGESLSTSLSAI